MSGFFSFIILYTVDRSPWMGDQPVASSLGMRRTAQTQNTRAGIFMARVGFEPTTPALKWAKTVHALDRAALPRWRLKRVLLYLVTDAIKWVASIPRKLDVPG
jgi:hypothetical protein